MEMRPTLLLSSVWNDDFIGIYVLLETCKGIREKSQQNDCNILKIVNFDSL